MLLVNDFNQHITLTAYVNGIPDNHALQVSIAINDIKKYQDARILISQELRMDKSKRIDKTTA